MDILLILKALIMAVVEGITEFLPISSTGFLIITAELLSFWTPEKSDAFVVIIQLGAILAIIYEYWGRLWHAFIGLLTGKADGLSNPRQLGLSLIVATIPMLILGFTFAEQIKTYLFNVYTVSVMLIIGGLLIFWIEKHHQPSTSLKAEDIDIKTAIKIGLIQCLALIPGTSRSGATIMGAFYLGASRTAAAEFSFFLGIPVLVGAGLLDTYKSRDVLMGSDWGVIAVGVIASFVSALVVVRWLVAWVSRRDYTLFAWLRIATGVAVLLSGMMGWIQWQ